MPTLDPRPTPENVSYDQQLAEEERLQAAGAPPSLPPDVLSSVSVPGTSAAADTGLETQFEPLPHHVGLFDITNLCRRTETLLIFRETAGLFQGHGYELRDSDGTVVIAVKSHVISLHDTKDILSADGDLLFQLKSKLVAVKRTFEGERDGQHVFEIKRTLGGAMECVFQNMALATDVGVPNSPSKAAIVLQGNFHDGTGDLVFQRGGESITVAQVRHSAVKGHTIVRDAQTYFVKVAAGVDLALIGTICLCFEQLREEKGYK